MKKSFHQRLVVRLSDLPPRGLTLNESYDITTINEKLQVNGDEGGIQFRDPLQLNLKLMPLPGGAEAIGEISGKYYQQCGRCLEPVIRNLRSEIRAYLKIAREDSTPEFDDAGLFICKGETVQLIDIIDELVILSLSPFWNPDENDESGHNCAPIPTTKEPLNSANSLATALAAAGLKKKH